MDRNILTSAIMKIVYDNKNIICLLETDDRMNSSITDDGLLDFKFTIGVKDLTDELKLLESVEEIIKDSYILHKQENLSVMNNYFVNLIRYITILKDITKVDFTFMRYEDIQSYIDLDSLCKIHIDKEDKLIGNAKITDVKYRQLQPTNREYIKCCNEFFIKSLAVAKGIYRGEIVYSMNVYRELHDRLQTMTNYYIGCEYGFSVNIGKKNKNIITYLEVNHYDKFLESFPVPDKDKLLNILYNTFMLFRKEGLLVAEKLNFEYPKEADREIIKYIRELCN